jgi:hypothetical protein
MKGLQAFSPSTLGDRASGLQQVNFHDHFDLSLVMRGSMRALSYFGVPNS